MRGIFLLGATQENVKPNHYQTRPAVSSFRTGCPGDNVQLWSNCWILDQSPISSLRGTLTFFIGIIVKDFFHGARCCGPITIGGYIASLSAGLLLAGCQTLGPTALGFGRGAYNDVIARTGSEQTLGLIVRLRYSDPIGLLAVSNITAGLKFTAETKTEAGFGPRSNYSGNLVPFSASIGYEDSSTISYALVDAEAFLREWLTPVTMEMLAKVLQAGLDSPLTALLVERMNGLRSGANTSVEEQNAFNRAVTLLLQFREGGMASWAEQSGNAKQYELILANYSPAHITDVEELLRLLDLRGDPARESTIRIPVVMGVRDGKFDGLAIQTRSVAVIMRNAAAAIDVPREHIEEGIVEASSEVSKVLTAPGPMLRIRSSRSAPERASVAVQHRGWWYYVDDADRASKRVFLDIQMLFLTRLAEAARGTQAAPLLTIPVK